MENQTQKMTMQMMQKSFQQFGLTDYIVFATMLLGCSGIGVYYALTSKKNEKSGEADEYLLGGRNMKVFPIALSLIASYISGITLLGTPTEMYLHGNGYMYIMIGVIVNGFTASRWILPVFHDLKLSSTYEYLRIRFDKRVQLMGSVLFTCGLVFWLPIVIYVPALAFNQVTGVNVHIITPLVCVVCIFYTCVGGLKAVVWTDVVQTFLMIGAIFIIIIKGTLDIGGLQVVWQRNFDSGRLEIPSFDPDLTIRHSALAVSFGMSVHYLQTAIVNQNMIQRFLCLPNLKGVNIALWSFIAGCCLFILICGYAGLLAYATYFDCDPLTTGLAKEKDQLLPLLVMQVLSNMPGMPGVFVAGVFSAALSSLSTGLNSMSAVVLEDFIKPNIKTPLSEKATHYILRGVVVVFGIICVCLVFIVEKLGSVLQLSMSLSAVNSGASFGIFIGGMFLPWISAQGALFGGICGLIASSVLAVGYQHASAIGALAIDNKMTSVAGCEYTYLLQNITSTSFIENEIPSTFAFFRLSYLYHTLFGGLVTITFSLIISYVTGFNDYKNMDTRIFSPLIRSWLDKKRTKVSPHEGKALLNFQVEQKEVKISDVDV